MANIDNPIMENRIKLLYDRMQNETFEEYKKRYLKHNKNSLFIFLTVYFMIIALLILFVVAMNYSNSYYENTLNSIGKELCQQQNDTYIAKWHIGDSKIYFECLEHKFIFGSNNIP